MLGCFGSSSGSILKEDLGQAQRAALFRALLAERARERWIWVPLGSLERDPYLHTLAHSYNPICQFVLAVVLALAAAVWSLCTLISIITILTGTARTPRPGHCAHAAAAAAMARS